MRILHQQTLSAGKYFRCMKSFVCRKFVNFVAVLMNQTVM